MEIEIKDGVFISVVKKDEWIRRTGSLPKEDLKYFVKRCNPARFAQEHLLNAVLGVGKDKLFEECRKIDPDFDIANDFYVIRT